MKAVGFNRPLPVSDENSLLDIELPAPEPKPHDLLVEVYAVSVNPADVKVRRGLQFFIDGAAHFVQFFGVALLQAGQLLLQEYH